MRPPPQRLTPKTGHLQQLEMFLGKTVFLTVASFFNVFMPLRYVFKQPIMISKQPMMISKQRIMISKQPIILKKKGKRPKSKIMKCH